MLTPALGEYGGHRRQPNGRSPSTSSSVRIRRYVPSTGVGPGPGGGVVYGYGMASGGTRNFSVPCTMGLVPRSRGGWTRSTAWVSASASASIGVRVRSGARHKQHEHRSDQQALPTGHPDRTGRSPKRSSRHTGTLPVAPMAKTVERCDGADTVRLGTQILCRRGLVRPSSARLRSERSLHRSASTSWLRSRSSSNCSSRSRTSAGSSASRLISSSPGEP